MKNNFLRRYTLFLVGSMTLLLALIIGCVMVSSNDNFDNAYQGEYYFKRITNVRYQVPNVNQALVQFIPNDVHYVSYHPNKPKAVYCYYHQSNKAITLPQFTPLSRCYFIQLIDNHLTKYDISDLIRLNLQNYYINFRQDIYHDYAYVEQWVDREDLLFGLYFVVNPTFNRYGWGDYY